jgi:hypothetical protein
MHDDALATRYRDAAGSHAAARDRQRRRARVVSYSRLVTFLAGAGFLGAAWWSGTAMAGVFGACAALLLLSFGVLVYVHGRLDEREQWHDALARLNLEAAARVQRDWPRLPPVEMTPAGASHAYAEDLGIFGRASLFQLLAWTGSRAGRETLSRWLLEPAPADEVRERQAAVRELAPLETFREEFGAVGRLVPPEAQELEPFFRWAETSGWMLGSRWLVPVTHGLRLASLGLLALHLFSVIDRPLWLYPVAPGLLLSALCGRRIVSTYARVFSRQPLFQQHAEMFRRLAALTVSSPRLVELQRRLASSGLTAAAEMERLDRLKRLADLRFQALFHFPVNALALWDLLLVERVERWQRRAGVQVREWFEILGEADALCALASIAHDNPDWAFPTVDEGATRLVARDLGHPLLRGDTRVCNDVEVGPPGTVLLVTGSNMSGKSTLLRSIGVNVVLAQAGAPVCAASMTLPPLLTWTSMRVQDSLEEGVSYFMAALRRLKLVVEAARRSPSGPPRLLYLLDEILQGTNTAERQVAVRHILRHLLDLPVIGAVTTHDLELAASSDLERACVPVHFTEGVEADASGGRLSFDYRVRPGIASSRNALKLLHLVGLDSL